VYQRVPRLAIIDALIHIRDLYRQVRPIDGSALRAQERREAVIRDLLSNLPRMGEHPTLKTLLEVTESCGLTLEGAHRLFGYDLGGLRDYDLLLNGSRTHIVESYPFKRDSPIDLPLRLASHDAFQKDALLRQLVPEWQTDLPIGTLEGGDWSRAGAFYVHVGTEDSLGSSIPPGAMALVEPVDRNEELRPNPRHVYLLQFAYGYRCSHCVATSGKLQLFSSTRTYMGREEIFYPGSVRIAGRIRMFALSLPVPENSSLRPLPRSQQGAPLVLPWEHSSRDRLLAAKHRRFRRSKDQEQLIREVLQTELHARLSERSERRYRSETSSEPHVNALLHLTVAHSARYMDSLRTGGAFPSDSGRFSLESLLNVTRIEDLKDLKRRVETPRPPDVWNGLRKQFIEWPPLLSMKFPHLKRWDERVIRLAEGSTVGGLNPPIRPGSWLLLEKTTTVPDAQAEGKKSGWSRPLYLFHRGMENFCGYLEREGARYALLSDANGQSAKAIFESNELSFLNRVVGIAIPI
jgi:hypothetical protein